MGPETFPSTVLETPAGKVQHRTSLTWIRLRNRIISLISAMAIVAEHRSISCTSSRSRRGRGRSYRFVAWSGFGHIFAVSLLLSPYSKWVKNWGELSCP